MKFLFSLVLLITSFAVNAQTPVLVNTLESDNETYIQFVERTARYVNEWTNNSKVELCGIFTQNGSMYRVILSTNYSQLSCKMVFVTNGDMVTGDSIHSHPEVDNLGRLRVTRQTNEQDGDFTRGRPYVKISNHSFSPMDYAVGNGFLVVEGKLYYQHGKNTQVFVTNL